MNISTNTMINGDIFWNNAVLKDLEPVSLKHGDFELYQDAPRSFFDSLTRSAEKFPDKVCIVDDNGTPYTYGQFLDMTEDFSRVLFHRYGVRPGSRIGLLLYNSIEFCVAFYAINRLNAAAVPLSTKYRKQEILSLAEKADLFGLIYEKDFESWFADSDVPARKFSICISSRGAHYALPKEESPAALPELLPEHDDIAVIMFTSGTTSQSKGVVMTNYNTMHAVTVYKRIFEITESDSTVIPVPIYHVTGLIAVLGLFVASGGRVYLHKFFDAQRVVEDIAKNQITFFHSAPTVFSLLLEKRKEYPSLPSLRILACGSSNMPAAKIRLLKEWLPNMQFRTVYGLTETSSPATIFPGDASASPYIGSSGHPVPGTLFKITDEEGMILPPGHVGTICIKGSVVTPGYIACEVRPLKDGWLDTGDLGYFNEAGYLYIVDRKKDMINRGGEKVCSIDVENILYNTPGIIEAAVVGIPDEKYGEIPAAMITLEQGCELTPEKIRELLLPQLAKFQIPAKILITDSLPLTPNSKVDKKRIRQLLTQIP